MNQFSHRDTWHHLRLFFTLGNSSRIGRSRALRKEGERVGRSVGVDRQIREAEVESPLRADPSLGRRRSSPAGGRHRQSLGADRQTQTGQMDREAGQTSLF